MRVLVQTSPSRYEQEDGWKLVRGPYTDKGGNQLFGWQLFNEDDEQIDESQYRNDLASRHKLTLEDQPQ